MALQSNNSHNMQQAMLAPSKRIRETPFTPFVQEAGVKMYTVYNRMLLPTMFSSHEEDYRHLKNHVQLWDVSCQRQVSIKGPDAHELLSLITPRNVDKMKDDQCFYLPVVDHHGRMLNDPVAIKIDNNHYWLSVADGDLLQFCLGISLGKGLEVDISEPEVFPLAVQGPKAEQLLVRVFGESVKAIKFFRYKWLAFEDTQLLVARSGWSKQGGFEIYMHGMQYAPKLWKKLSETGQDLNVRAGCPNLIERIESGLLSFGNDITRDHTPVEAGLQRFCDSNKEYLGRKVIEQQKQIGPPRQICAAQIDGDVLPPSPAGFSVQCDGEVVGNIASVAWSPDFKTNVAIAMMDKGFGLGSGHVLKIDPGMGLPLRTVQIREKFWN